MPDGSLAKNSFGREALKNREASGDADPTLVGGQLADAASDSSRIHRRLAACLDVTRRGAAL